MRIFVLVVDNMFDTGLTVILDTLAMAHEFISDQGDRVPFEVAITGVRPSIHTRLGLSISVTLAPSLPCPDVVVVPAFADKTPELRFCRINHGMIHLHSYLFAVIDRSFRIPVSSILVQMETLPA